MKRVLTVVAVGLVVAATACGSGLEDAQPTGDRSDTFGVEPARNATSPPDEIPTEAPASKSTSPEGQDFSEAEAGLAEVENDLAGLDQELGEADAELGRSQETDVP